MISHKFYIQESSPVHGLNFWTKTCCLLLLLPLSAFLGSVWLLAFVTVVSLVIFLLSNIGIKTVWNATKSYLIAVTLGMMMLSIIFREGKPWLLAALNGLELGAKFIVLISLGILFSMTTSPIEIVFGLMRVGLPHFYGITVMVAFRMLPMISQKIQNVIDAQRARGAKIDLRFRSLPMLPSHVAALVVPVLHSTLETSVEFSEVLLSRGYDPNRPVTLPPQDLKAADVLLFTVSLVLVGLAVFKVI
jgi:energy-coupling factor transporter transmembrane protein EcfT